MPELALNVLDNELDEAATFARSQGLGLEVTTFAAPRNLEEDNAELVARHVQALGGIAPIASHGPFMDLAVASHDPAIVTVCEQRHRRSLQAAIQLGATIYVAHTNFNPIIRNDAYKRGFARRACDFWLPLADAAGESNVTIALENLWEAGPEIQQRLVETANHPCLKASYDNGHALVFSTKPAPEWIEALKDSLVHLHLHDNHREKDEHLPVGQGSEDWPGLLEAVLRHTPGALLVVESDRVEANKNGLRHLRSELAKLAGQQAQSSSH